MPLFSYFKPITTALSPNVESDDIFLVLGLLLPWNWKKWQTGNELGELENKFREYLGLKYASSFSSGRAGLYAILKSIREINDFSGGQFAVLTQAYTTIAIPNAIKEAGFKPVYADIREKDYSIDPEKIETKITPQVKIIIVQHTFGIPADMDKILAIARKHNLIVIEDCAHSLGAKYGGKKVGTFGEAAFFSLGRDKIISSVSGGIVATNNHVLAEKITLLREGWRFPGTRWVFGQLAHPILFWFALPLYYFFSIGKAKIFLAQKIGLLKRAYADKEKLGIVSGSQSCKLANAMAILALNQFKKIERFNSHRKKLADLYERKFHLNLPVGQEVIGLPLIMPQSEITPLYYTVRVKYRNEILKFASSKHVILGDWFPGALGPKGIKLENFGYQKGECPVAEKTGEMSLNLPTNINTSEEDAEKVAEIIKKFIKNSANSDKI